jgi:ribosomal protein L11 methylase PrmA
MKPGGILIVSGIHPEGLDEVLISFALADLKLLSLEREEQWYSVTAKRKK